jgi:hypothetical protein
MVTAPILMPVAFGWVVGVVCPAAMLTVVGEKVSLERSLLVSVTVTPPAGAGVPNVTGKSTEVLRPTFKFDGTVIAPGGVTVTPAVALAILGVVVLAVIVVDPCPMAVTGTLTLFWLAGMVKDTGTVATPLLEELRVNVTPEGAITESVRERFCTPVPVIVRLGGEKLAVPVTFTTVLADPKPFAVAVIVELPKSMPFTIGVKVGVVWPSGKKTLPDTSPTLDVSLLVSETVTPPVGAGVAKVTEKGACWPGGTVTLEGRLIAP